MKKNLGAKIFAILALFGIIIGIIGTGILSILQSGNDYGTETIELTPEQIQELIQQQEQSSSGILEDTSAIEAITATQSGEIVEEENQ